VFMIPLLDEWASLPVRRKGQSRYLQCRTPVCV
jgi:hypothetical protein